ncbi:DNA gyrase subunit A [Desulfitibacter alkalitolerans]|uniref:DNA gyrase subunit A n=1 Tax=Desulfitibacter alkalitolerans TaxID=264641 RepID=UPI0004818D2E|nr:DNA gyrase subunit A [Desulfitibacter alkalitolerans]
MGEILEGKVVPVNIEQEMKKSYIDYAMSVIVGRALPDVRDGLKPVHRRILYAMYESGMTPDKPHKKSANVVGNVLAKYHPHGDSAVYDTLVRMAQDFSFRYPLVDGHGNFGSVDGDSAAAMRYTEARMAKIAMELLKDINKETVDFIPNYDESTEEPIVLPSKVPNLLINGSAGIAVGMATNIPPHNLGEVIDGVIDLIDNPDISIDGLMKRVKGPDFPTAGIILGTEGIKKAYRTGRGSIKIRAKAEIEKLNNGKTQVIITEIPYQVNKARLIEKIAELAREKKVEGITDLRDESDRKGMRIVIELRKDVNPNVLLNQLYKHTQLQENFGVIMLAIVDGAPKVLNLKQVLEHYVDHQKNVIVRRTKYDLKKAKERAHIVEGLRIALRNLDAIIKLIRSSKNTEEAKVNLINNFSLSDIQAQAILDMRLQRLTALEREKLENEYKELMEKIDYYMKILADEKLVTGIIKDELKEVKQQYNDPRRTHINLEDDVLEIEDLIEQEEVVITITHRGYIKRLNVDTYKSQKRGGRGISGMATRDEDFVEHLFVANTHQYLLFFTNKGKVYRLKVHEIPEASRQAKGTSIVNLLYLESGESLTTVIPVKKFEEGKNLITITAKGIVKKSDLSDYDTSRKDGIIALTLSEGDELIGVRLTDGNKELILGTRKGKSIRFSEKEVRKMGRTARGVKAIELSAEDRVVSMDIIEKDSQVICVTENGFGKRTDSEEYRIQSRGGKGILALKITEKTGSLVGLRVVQEQQELMIVTKDGIIIRTEVEGISQMGRVTQGVKLMRIGERDKVSALAKLNIHKENENVELD